MPGCMEHGNVKLDLTVEDGGLEAALECLARLDTGTDIHGLDPFAREKDRMCLAYKPSENGYGMYVGSAFEQDGGLDEPGWTKIRNGLDAAAIASEIRKALMREPRQDPGLDGTVGPGWRFLEPKAAAWEYEGEPEDFECAFAYVKFYTCKYPK